MVGAAAKARKSRIGEVGEGGLEEGSFSKQAAAGIVTLKILTGDWAGEEYIGEWDDASGKAHGEGVLTYANGSKYTGQFSYGSLEGQGHFMAAHGSWEFDGAFVNGEMHGEGKYKVNGAGVRWGLDFGRAGKVLRIHHSLGPRFHSAQQH